MNHMSLNDTTTDDLPGVFFEGSPSQWVNTVVVLRSTFIVVMSAYIVASTRVPWWAGGVAMLLALLYLGIALLKTAVTQVTIDEERVTLRQGILQRTAMSVELFRIQHTWLNQRWWERIVGIATLALHTSDTGNPTWYLRGMRDADMLRVRLNKAAIALRDRKGYGEVNYARV